ncbi:MAG: hypothetical protein LBI29_04050 [Rickettsiales bacterium]|jgi:hypothetical protein|nr:hypothetical protein [Rickettsiales bacterium]
MKITSLKKVVLFVASLTLCYGRVVFGSSLGSVSGLSGFLKFYNPYGTSINMEDRETVDVLRALVKAVDIITKIKIDKPKVYGSTTTNRRGFDYFQKRLIEQKKLAENQPKKDPELPKQPQQFLPPDLLENIEWQFRHDEWLALENKRLTEEEEQANKEEPVRNERSIKKEELTKEIEKESLKIF